MRYVRYVAVGMLVGLFFVRLGGAQDAVLTTSAQGADMDGDGVPDATDNCVQVPNAGQEDADGDVLGDACEAFSSMYDTDGDGYSDINETGAPLCIGGNQDSFDDSLVNDGCPTLGVAETVCTGSADDDGDARVNDGCPQGGLFSEGEFNIGTNHRARCGVGFEPHPSLAWPSDLKSGGIPDSTDRVNINDVTTMIAPTPSLNTRPGQPGYDERMDFVPGPQVGTAWISIGDLTALFASSSGFPPMFGGAKAFNGPTCTAHPVYGD
jgi:hypothetical protein